MSNLLGKIGSYEIQLVNTLSGVSLENAYVILFIYVLRTAPESYSSVAAQTTNIICGEYGSDFSVFEESSTSSEIGSRVPW